MSEIIDFKKFNGPDIDNLRWAMCEIMAHKDSMLNPWKKKYDPESPDLLKFEVEMKIDGVEVQFSTILKMMFEQYDDQVKAKALDILGDKIYNLQSSFDEMLNNLKRDFGVQS